MTRLFRKIIGSAERFLLFRVLHADDTPQRLALGIALGIGVAFTPTIGVQMILVVLLATIFRANARVGIPFVFISNPFTLVPVYLPSYWLGHHILDLFFSRPQLNLEQARKVLCALDRPLDAISSLFTLEFWCEIGRLFLQISAELWVGSLVVSLFMGTISYILAFKLIVWLRSDHPRARRFLAGLQRRHWRPDKGDHDNPS